MSYSLTVTRKVNADYQLNGVQGQYMEVEITAAVDVDKEIFVFQREMMNPETQATGDFFSNVCSVTDLQELPVTAPTDNSQNMFRLAKVCAFFRSRYELEETWNFVMQDINELLAALKRKDTLGTTQTFNFSA